jgi:hypothetical protein
LRLSYKLRKYGNSSAFALPSHEFHQTADPGNVGADSALTSVGGGRETGAFTKGHFGEHCFVISIENMVLILIMGRSPPAIGALTFIL